MKTALILSGQIRDARECIPSIFDFILKPYKPDVFIHTWLPTKNIVSHGGVRHSDDVSLTEITQVFKPKSILVEEFETEQNKRIDTSLKKISKNSILRIAYNGTYAVETKINNVYFMYYGIHKANQLRKEYAANNHVKYDMVIRARFDVKYDWFPIFCPEEDKIYLPIGSKNRGAFSDLLQIGTEKVMDGYCNIFKNVQETLEDRRNIIGRSLHPETLMMRYIEQNKLHVERFYLNYYLRNDKVDQTP